MKALKLKSSTKENPVWGISYFDEYSRRYSTIQETDAPCTFEDHTDINDFYSRHSDYWNGWELVTVKIIIE